MAAHPQPAASSAPPSTEAPTIYYLGPRGTYSHQVAMALRESLHLPPATPLIPCPNIAQTLATAADSIREGGALPLALLPFENSTFGPVRETWSLLSSKRSSLCIVAEHSLAVAHALLVGEETMEDLWRRWERKEGKKRSDADERGRLEALGGIERVVSHEQALGQCQRFLSTYLPSASAEPVPSTAEGATLAASASSLLSQDAASSEPPRLTASIGSEICADPQAGIELESKLLIAQRAIQDRDDNTTRFILVRLGPGKRGPEPPAAEVNGSETTNGHAKGRGTAGSHARSILLQSYPASEGGGEKQRRSLVSHPALVDLGIKVQLVASRDVETFAAASSASERGQMTALVELAIRGSDEGFDPGTVEDALVEASKELDEGKGHFDLLGVWSVPEPAARRSQQLQGDSGTIEPSKKAEEDA